MLLFRRFNKRAMVCIVYPNHIYSTLIIIICCVLTFWWCFEISIHKRGNLLHRGLRANYFIFINTICYAYFFLLCCSVIQFTNVRVVLRRGSQWFYLVIVFIIYCIFKFLLVYRNLINPQRVYIRPNVLIGNLALHNLFVRLFVCMPSVCQKTIFSFFYSYVIPEILSDYMFD